MDLQTAVAASMLPGSRSLVAAAFKEARYAGFDGPGLLGSILARLGFPPDAHAEIGRLAWESAAAAIERGKDAGFRAAAIGDSWYPPLLACIRDPPPVLWLRGDSTALERPAVAVIGSRGASPYAVAVGERLGAELASRGVVVASGLARGVDSAAHRGCLSAGGVTAAILGSGLDRIYPAEHRALALNISKHGVLLSELGPGAAPLRGAFPAPQPNHQRDLAGRCRRRSLREERVVDYRPIRP